MNDKVLVACPTWSGCEYALKDWAAAYHALTYENKGALQVDNSDGPMHGGNLHYTHLIRGQGIPAIWQQTRFPALWDTLELSWNLIVEYAHAHGYDWIFSVEADVIVPPDAIDKMLDAAYDNADPETGKPAVVTQRYHPRGQDGPNFWWDTLGCSLFPVEPLWQDRNLAKAIYEIEVFVVTKRHGHPRYRPGHDGPDLFIPKHLKNPNDTYVHVFGGTPAPTAYTKRVMEANGMKLQGQPAVANVIHEPDQFSNPDGAALDKVYGGAREVEDKDKWSSAMPLKDITEDEDAKRVVFNEDRIRLNLGCDRQQISGFLGVDFNPDVNPDVLAEVTDLPFEDNTVDEIYASHVLEHLKWDDGMKALKEWYRVLRPGGMVTIAVPDIIQTYYLYKHTGRWGEYHMPIDETYIQAVAFGANLLADKIPEMRDMYGGPGHKHQSIYFFDMLLNRVIEAGFEECHETAQCFLRLSALGETMVEAKKPKEVLHG